MKSITAFSSSLLWPVSPSQPSSFDNADACHRIVISLINPVSASPKESGESSCGDDIVTKKKIIKMVWKSKLMDNDWDVMFLRSK